VIERELAYQPGDLYQRSLIQDTQRRFTGMELFQFVSVQPLEVNEQPENCQLGVRGRRQAPAVNFSAGYGSEERARVDAEHGISISWAAPAWRRCTRVVVARSRRPPRAQPAYFFARTFSWVYLARTGYTYAGYRWDMSGDKVMVTHRDSAATSWSVFLSSERQTSTVATDVLGDATLRNNLIAVGLDPTTGFQHGTATIVGFDLQHSTADNLLNARRGYQAAFHIEQAGRFLPGTFSYWLISADGRHYLPIGTRLVWANRAQAGNIDPTNGDQRLVPFAKKYFLGGATSIRGWGRYEVSPLSDDGLPVGGDSMFAFTSELRASLVGNLGGVLFFDGGSVEAGPWGVRFNDLNYSVGPGLRYQTPIGPGSTSPAPAHPRDQRHPETRHSIHQRRRHSGGDPMTSDDRGTSSAPARRLRRRRGSNRLRGYIVSSPLNGQLIGRSPLRPRALDALTAAVSIACPNAFQLLTGA
jgi:outer membrane protein insertion porin family